jgi:uncharacterized protein
MGRETPVNEAKSPPLSMTSPTLSAPLGGLDRLPPICGDFNMRIDRQGTWYYQGSPIGRLPLVKLFSAVLRRDDAGEYWLTTPVENGRIAVEDVPFIAVEAIIEGQGSARVVKLRTNVDDIVTLDADHPLRVDIDPQGQEPRPYLRVRANLDARLARSVYYHLVDLGESHPHDPAVFGLWSCGQFFTLGRL